MPDIEKDGEDGRQRGVLQRPDRLDPYCAITGRAGDLEESVEGGRIFERVEGGDDISQMVLIKRPAGGDGGRCGLLGAGPRGEGAHSRGAHLRIRGPGGPGQGRDSAGIAKHSEGPDGGQCDLRLVRAGQPDEIIEMANRYVGGESRDQVGPDPHPLLAPPGIFQEGERLRVGVVGEPLDGAPMDDGRRVPERVAIKRPQDVDIDQLLHQPAGDPVVFPGPDEGPDRFDDGPSLLAGMVQVDFGQRVEEAPGIFNDLALRFRVGAPERFEAREHRGP